MIRKEIKKFRDAQEAVSFEADEGDKSSDARQPIAVDLTAMEISLCDRKLTLLRTRKEDELAIRAKDRKKNAKRAAASALQHQDSQMKF